MKYGKKLLLPIIALAILVPLLLTTVKAHAQSQSSYDVTLTPVYFDLTANPGSVISEKIRIRNNTSSPIPIKLQVQEVTGDLNGNITLKADQNDQSLTWVKFQSPTLVLTPLDWTDVPFTINIPPDAAYGYYLAISFTQDKNNPLTRSGASITGAAAVPILLDVLKEGAKAEGKILQFSTNSYVSEYLPIDFNVKVEDTGNVHIQPHGSIFISNGSNNNIAILDVNTGLANVIPQSARNFTASWDDGFLVNEPVMVYGQPQLDKYGQPVYHLAINWNKLTSFRIGKYDANLLLVFNNGTRDVPLEAEVSFWVFPYKIIGGLILAIIILILLLRFAIKSYVKREIKKTEALEKSSK